MENLIQALNSIMNWLESHLPEYAASFLPGLQFDEIINLERRLGFSLTSELYELYKWRNGTRADVPSFIFPVFEFAPLDKAIAIQDEISHDSVVK